MSTLPKPTVQLLPQPYWERPSAAVRQLMRQGAELALAAPPEMMEELDHIILTSSALHGVADDPLIAAAICRSNRANLRHWAASNISNPGEPVMFNMGPEPLGIARDLVRRGVGGSALSAYRIGQNFALQKWIGIAFILTQDPVDLKELLEVSTRSICAFIDTMIDGLNAQMNAERDFLTQDTHAERRALISLLIEGTTMTAQRVSQKLGYQIEQAHRAAVIWTDQVDPEYSVLEQAATVLAQITGVGRPLTVLASAASVWVWLPADGEVDLTALRLALHRFPDIRIAIGSLGHNMDGFKRSHLDALTCQKLLIRLSSNEQIISHDNVWLVSLITHDMERANLFVNYVLGDLAKASRNTQHTLLVYLHEGCCVTRTAERLYAHRNTVLRRLAHAEELLPRPLESNRIQVAVALEILGWK